MGEGPEKLLEVLKIAVNVKWHFPIQAQNTIFGESLKLPFTLLLHYKKAVLEYKFTT